MDGISVGDRVRILTGWYAGQIGTVFAIGSRDQYPVFVDLPNGDVNAYYEEQVEVVRDNGREPLA